MSRVSENSTTASINYSLNKTKAKLENLQMKGSSLKNMTKPSDNPLGNVEALGISSVTNDNRQFLKNIDFATLQLNVTETAIEQITDILGKAKEIAIAQSSDFYGEDIRKSVANEVIQLKNQLLSIANKRVGQRYIFSGYKTLSRPFDQDGKYYGDKGHVTLEVSKDFFVPINLHGEEIFYTSDSVPTDLERPFKDIPEIKNPKANPEDDVKILASRSVASADGKEDFHKRSNIFSHMNHLISSLENNDAESIRNLLEKFDQDISRLITLRTRVGSISSSVAQTASSLESDQIENMARKSKLVDADIAELYADITKQQEILKATYKSSQTLMNQNLLDFLR